MSTPDISALIGLPPDDTLRAFQARGELRLTTNWDEMFGGDHARAFTAAKIAKLDIVAALQESFRPVVDGGMTLEAWQASVRPELERLGWWGRVENRESTGTDRPVFIGPRRLRTIFNTNLRVSRAAGQWARIQELKGVAPYLRYVAVNDSRTRDEHRRWHGTILRWDHPWWDTHFPPCGWNCRCTVDQLSERDLRAFGYEVSKEPPPEGRPRPYQRSNGEVVSVPKGIDPGWAYNPGKAHLRAVGEKAVASVERAASADVPAARAVVADLLADRAFSAVLAAADGPFPVAVLDDAAAGMLGAEARAVILPGRAMPGLPVEVARTLPQLAADPILVVEDRAVRVVVYRDGGTLFRAALRIEDGAAVLDEVVALGALADAELDALAASGRVLLDRR